MATAALKITVDEFLASPSIDGIKRELLDGEIVEVPMSFAHEPHEIIKSRILGRLFLAAGEPRKFVVMAESLYRFSETVSLIPDISVLVNDRPSISAHGHMTYTPEIVVEVVSSESAERLFRKVNAYRSRGVKEVWVVLPHDAEVLIYAPTGITELRRKDTLTSPLLPGFLLPLEELFS